MARSTIATSPARSSSTTFSRCARGTDAASVSIQRESVGTRASSRSGSTVVPNVSPKTAGRGPVSGSNAGPSYTVTSTWDSLTIASTRPSSRFPKRRDLALPFPLFGREPGSFR